MFTLFYQTHGLPSNIYTGSLKVSMGLCSQQYLCIDKNLNLYYTPTHLNKFQTIFLMDTNQTHMIGESVGSHGDRRRRILCGDPKS